MGCSHNFVYTQGYFVCTKCGKRSYGRTHRKKQGKKIATGIIIALVVGIVFFAFSNGIFEINQENLEKSIQNIPSEIPDISIPLPELPTIDRVKEVIPKIQEELPKIQESTKQVIKPTLDTEKIEQITHQKINIERNKHGLSSLSYDNQIANIARNHSQDMAQNNYFEHKSLSGKEPWDRGFPYGYNTCGTAEAISLQNKYDELAAEYDKYPQTISNPSRYQEAMSLYKQLTSISSQLESLTSQGKLFAGLAENIAQDWTYESITYINGIPVYHWNTEEMLAEQTVQGWMNSPGHRENILSGFHTEGIGVSIADDDKVYITQNFC